MSCQGHGFRELKHYRQTHIQAGATERVTTPHARVEINAVTAAAVEDSVRSDRGSLSAGVCGD